MFVIERIKYNEPNSVRFCIILSIIVYKRKTFHWKVSLKQLLPYESVDRCFSSKVIFFHLPWKESSHLFCCMKSSCCQRNIKGIERLQHEWATVKMCFLAKRIWGEKGGRKWKSKCLGKHYPVGQQKNIATFFFHKLLPADKYLTAYIFELRDSSVKKIEVSSNYDGWNF